VRGTAPTARNRRAFSSAFHSAADFLNAPHLAHRSARDYSSFMARPDCPHCEGSGWKVVSRGTTGAAALAADKPGASAAGEPNLVWAIPCDCTMGDKTERALHRARVPERYRHCDFENYETDNELEGVAREQTATYNRSLAQAKLVVQRFAEEFLPVAEARTEHGLLLMGPCGVGKTHLAVAAMKAIVLRGHSGLYYDYRELLKEIQNSYNPENQATEMGVLEPVLKAEILVLDDVGASKPSPWALETVGHILNTRYNEQRVTILTTNYLDADSSASASGASSGSSSGAAAAPARALGLRAPAIEDSLAERVGRRIRSRLYEMCRTVEIFAPDYRKEIRAAGHYRS
jgi:DNA replication protein DnaC